MQTTDNKKDDNTEQKSLCACVVCKFLKYVNIQNLYPNNYEEKEEWKKLKIALNFITLKYLRKVGDINIQCLSSNSSWAVKMECQMGLVMLFFISDGNMYMYNVSLSELMEQIKTTGS